MKKCFLLFAVALVLASCAQVPPQSYAGDLPNFFSGIGHGFIAPFALIASFFMDAHIYAYPNSGRSYDIGFVLGFAFLVGGATNN